MPEAVLDYNMIIGFNSGNKELGSINSHKAGSIFSKLDAYS